MHPISLSLSPSRSSRLSRSRTGRHPAGPRAPIVLPATCRNFHTATRMLSNKVGTRGIIPRWLCSIYPGSYSTFSAPFGPTFVRCFARVDLVLFSRSSYCVHVEDCTFDDRQAAMTVWNGSCWFELFELWVYMLMTAMAWHFHAEESRGRFVGTFLRCDICRMK